MIPLNAYPAYTRRGELRLKFLSRLPTRRMSEIIDLFEKENRNIVREEELIEGIRRILKGEHDLRVANLAYYSMRTFYGLEEQKLPLVCRGERKIAIRDEWDLKKAFYRWVQEECGGFLPIERRRELLLRFCRQYGVDPEKLDTVLAGGILRGYKLVRKIQRPPTPDEVLGVSSFLLIEKTLCISNYATVIFYNVDRRGSLVKDLLYRSKRARLLLDFSIEGRKLICRLSGPFQLFKHPSPIYGEYISWILVGSLCRHSSWFLRASVRYRKRNYRFAISSRDPRLGKMIPPWKYTGLSVREKPFDSEVEEKLWNLLRIMFREATILREEDIVESEDGKIFIPDFTIELHDGGKVYVELVGFWTEDYARKKREKLDSIYRSGIRNIVAVVDAKLRKYFKDARFPVVYYEGYPSAARSLRKAIEQALRAETEYHG